MSGGDVLETSADGTFRVRVVQDEDPSNPREEFDNIAHALTVNDFGRYIPVDKDAGPLAEAFNRLDCDRKTEVFARWARIFHGAVLVESHPHDGAHSLWYMTGKEIADAQLTSAADAISGEIAEYIAWAEGDVYGYVVEKRTHWTNDGDPKDTRETWEEAESCWGYYGIEDAEAQARNALADITEPEKGK